MTMNDPIASGAQPEVQPLRLREAFEAARPALEAVEAKDLAQMNLEIPAATITVRGTIPELRTLQARLLAELPEADPAIFDKCERYTFALIHAHRQYVAASQPSQPIQELTETLKQLHDQLYTDVHALAKRGLLDGARLDMLSGTNGSKNTAFDVLALVAMLRDNWSKIEGKTPVNPAELDNAEQLADRLTDALGIREQGPVTVPEASLMRHRAYALFVKTYDEVRRIVGYLRWHEGDADEIAPSLYKGRYRKPGRSEETPDVAAQPAPAPAPAPAAPLAPAMAAPGMPNSPPFAQS